MKVSRFLVTALALFGALAPEAARSADVLYIGDEGDNTIKRFDADKGTFLGVSDGPSLSGLAGPRGLVVDGGLLLVVNQNVSLDIPGEVLRYNLALQFRDRLIRSDNPNAPFAPDGLVLGAPSGLNSVPPLPARRATNVLRPLRGRCAAEGEPRSARPRGALQRRRRVPRRGDNSEQ